MTTENPHTLVRTGKTWHGNDQIVVFQCNFVRRPSPEAPKKFFLVCDSNQSSRGFRLELKKPGNLKNPGMAANMLRKFMPASVIEDILIDDESGDHWAIFRTHREKGLHSYIRIQRSSPPELSFIDSDHKVLFKIGKRGSFTKKHDFEGDLPDPNSERYSSISENLQKIILIVKDEESDDENEDLETDDQSQASPFQKEAKNRLSRRIKTVRKSIAKMEQQIPSESEITDQNHACRLLQQYSYLIKPDMLELKIDTTMSGLDKDLIIEIEEHESSGQLVNDSFVKLKKMQKSRKLGISRLQGDKKNFDSMSGDLEILKSDLLDASQIETILKRYKIPIQKPVANKTSDGTSGLPYKTYQAADDSLIFVGKTSADNDILTKQSKSNDYWLHGLGVTGSHIVIPVKNLKNRELSTATKKEAAILALHFSKIRADQAGEVYFTTKQHVKKKKGMPPGLWSVEKSESLYIKYTDSELKVILGRLMI